MCIVHSQDRIPASWAGFPVICCKRICLTWKSKAIFLATLQANLLRSIRVHSITDNVRQAIIQPHAIDIRATPVDSSKVLTRLKAVLSYQQIFTELKTGLTYQQIFT